MYIYIYIYRYIYIYIYIHVIYKQGPQIHPLYRLLFEETDRTWPLRRLKEGPEIPPHIKGGGLPPPPPTFSAFQGPAGGLPPPPVHYIIEGQLATNAFPHDLLPF